MAENSISPMSISRLIQSSANVKGFAADEALKKRFGEIYAYNKKITPKPKNSIIEVSMMIKGATEKITKGKGSNRTTKPVAAHRVLLAIEGVKQQEYTVKEFINEVREHGDSAYKNKKNYPDDVIMELALKKNAKLLKNKTIMESTTQYEETYKRGKEEIKIKRNKIVVIDDHIKDSSHIQVWCSCSSYYWVFQFYNIEANVNLNLRGTRTKMPAYKYKTEKGKKAYDDGKPMRNPKKVPGLCKHLMLLLALLMDSNVIDAKSKNSQQLEVNYMMNINRFKKVDRITPEEYKRLMKRYSADRTQVIKGRRFDFTTGIYSQKSSTTNPYLEKFAIKMR